MTAPGFDLAVKDFQIGRTFNMQNADQATLHARQRMVDQDVIAGNVEFELGDDGAARRNSDGLHAAQRIAENSAQIVDAVEDFADQMERGGVVRAADAEEDTNGFADLGLQRMQLRERADRAIEDKILRPLVQQFVDAELLAAMMAKRRFGVDLALHDVELAIDRRQ